MEKKDDDEGGAGTGAGVENKLVVGVPEAKG